MHFVKKFCTAMVWMVAWFFAVTAARPIWDPYILSEMGYNTALDCSLYTMIYWLTVIVAFMPLAMVLLLEYDRSKELSATNPTLSLEKSEREKA